MSSTGTFSVRHEANGLAGDRRRFRAIAVTEVVNDASERKTA